MSDTLSITLHDPDTGELVHQGPLLLVVASVAGDLKQLTPLYEQVRERAGRADRSGWVWLAQQLGAGLRVNRAHKTFHQFACGDAVIARRLNIQDEARELIKQYPERKADVEAELQRALHQLWVDAAEAFGLGVKSVMNIVDVCESYDEDWERVHVLPFAFYDELRADPKDMRFRLLERAASDTPTWDRERLRAERAKLRRSAPVTPETKQEQKQATSAVDAALAAAIEEWEREERDDTNSIHDDDDHAVTGPQASGGGVSTELQRISYLLSSVSGKMMRAYFAMARQTGDKGKMDTAYQKARVFNERIETIRRDLDKLADALDTSTEQSRVIEGTVVA